jgi:hypothetical protein
MALSTIFGNSSQKRVQDYDNMKQVNESCGEVHLLDSKQNIISAINDLISRYNACGVDVCEIKACTEKYDRLVLAIKNNYKSPGFVNSHVKTILSSDFTFVDTDSDIFVFEKFLLFFEKNFIQQTTTNKIIMLNTLRALIAKTGGKKTKDTQTQLAKTEYAYEIEEKIIKNKYLQK